MAARRARRTRQDFHPRHRSDARQRFAGETQRGDPKQVLIFFEFTGRVTLHREREIFRRYSLPIVANANNRGTALFRSR